MTEINQDLQEKLNIVDELSKSYQRIMSVNKEGYSKKATEIGDVLLSKIEEVVESIEKVKVE